MQEIQLGAEQAVQKQVSQCVSECENEPVSEPASGFGSVFGPDCLFVCGCVLAASVWPGVVETEGHQQQGDCRRAALCSETPSCYWGLTVQEVGSAGVQEADTVREADCHPEGSQPVVEEVVVLWELRSAE